MRTFLMYFSVFTIMNLLGHAAAAQNVNIPDSIFKRELINNPKINTNNDNEIQVSEAQAVTESIKVVYQGIKDLTGIE